MTITHHGESLHDRAVMLAMRAMLALQPKAPLSPAGRPAADEMLAKTPAADGVSYEASTLGGVPGWWCLPESARNDAAILYLHGGAYVVGSAAGYRHFVGQLAGRSRLRAFIPDYSLAPERPFPAAFDDANAVYRSLKQSDTRQIMLAGDSAGGGLALALLASLVQGAASDRPFAALVFSPWIDLALIGQSVITRAQADPLLTRDMLAEAAQLYLASHDPSDPRVSALHAPGDRLPPVQIHVGEDEILLSDSMRYDERAAAVEGEPDLHIWKGMAHVFPANISSLGAAEECLGLSAKFCQATLSKLVQEFSWGQPT